MLGTPDIGALTSDSMAELITGSATAALVLWEVNGEAVFSITTPR